MPSITIIPYSQEGFLKELYSCYKKSTGVSTDTRSLKGGQGFFALKGPHFNGNEKAQEALDKKASFLVMDDSEQLEIISSRNTNSDHPEKLFVFLVPSVLHTLQALAQYHREQLSIPVIGLTGSNGKTTTKELMALVLSSRFRTRYTKGNLNNHIGVPLTLLSITDEDEMAIIEMGANAQGEIAQLCQIARPTHGLITNIGLAHLEGFGGPEGVFIGKKELFDFIVGTGGVFFQNMNDSRLRELSYHRNIPYGTGQENPFLLVSSSEGIIKSGPGLRAVFYFKGHSQGIEMDNPNLFGGYNLINMIAAATAAFSFAVQPSEIVEVLKAYTPNLMRSQIIHRGNNSIILDAYNANPSSMKDALSNLKQRSREDKLVLIMGDMQELGEFAPKHHQEVYELALELNPAQIILIGTEWNKIQTSSKSALLLDQSPDRDFIMRIMPSAPYTLFIKGSRKWRLETLVPEQ